VSGKTTISETKLSTDTVATSTKNRKQHYSYRFQNANSFTVVEA